MRDRSSKRGRCGAAFVSARPYLLHLLFSVIFADICYFPPAFLNDLSWPNDSEIEINSPIIQIFANPGVRSG